MLALGDVRVNEVSHPGGGKGVGGQHDDGNRGFKLPHFGGYGRAVHVGQVVVKHNQVNRMSSERGQPGPAVGRHQNLVPFAFQQELAHFRIRGAVINAEDDFPCGH